jgi:uncharacterized protein (DUF2141 family)
VSRPLLVAAVLLGPAVASAADLVIEVSNVRNTRGHVRLSVCDAAHFGGQGCAFDGQAPARPGVTRIVVHGVPAGRWAVQAFHDENDDDVFDTDFLGLPEEGFGYSNDPPLRGRPRFEPSAFDVRESSTEISFRLRYSIFD